MAEKNSVLESLSDLQDKGEVVSGSAGVAQVRPRRGRVRAQKWVSDERADTLLAGLLDESESELDAERHRRVERRQRKEEEDRARQEQEALRVESERMERMLRERARLAAETQRRTQMLVAIERQRRIDSGVLVEEQERHAEEEERMRCVREEAERCQKQEAFEHASAIIRQQEQKLMALAQQSMVTPKRRLTGWGIGFVAVSMLVLGAGGFWWWDSNGVIPQTDPYALEDSYPTALLALVAPTSPLREVGLDVVRQNEGAQVETIEFKKHTARKRTRSSSKRTTPKSTNEYEGIEGTSGILQGRGPRIIH